jgi:hypothetical protein
VPPKRVPDSKAADLQQRQREQQIRQQRELYQKQQQEMMEKLDEGAGEDYPSEEIDEDTSNEEHQPDDIIYN